MITYQLSDPMSHQVPRAAVPSRMLSILLWVTVGLVGGMVVLGGYTRLTGSGLSMVDWRPITGFLPPLNPADWQAVFDLYKDSPQYKQVNYGMDIEGFKGIFWLEYLHRLMGRFIGLFFLVPLFYSLRHPSLRHYFKWILGIWILGGLQGAMGWYMVKSGLIDDPMVSPYRLAAHLLLAFTTGSLLLWTGLQVRYGSPRAFSFPTKDTSLWVVLGSLLVTITYGAFVAGMKAGLLYNTFPLMGDQWIPDEWLFENPWFMNFLKNPVTVQLTHRVLALWTLASIWVYGLGRLSPLSDAQPQERPWIGVLLAASAIQVILGIATLILGVPMDLAVAHQTCALVVVLSFVGSLFFRSNRATPSSARAT